MKFLKIDNTILNVKMINSVRRIKSASNGDIVGHRISLSNGNYIDITPAQYKKLLKVLDQSHLDLRVLSINA